MLAAIVERGWTTGGGGGGRVRSATRWCAIVGGSCNSRKLKDNRAEVTSSPLLSSIVTGSASNAAATGQCASSEFHPRISCNCQTLVASDTSKERNGRIDVVFGVASDERRRKRKGRKEEGWKREGSCFKLVTPWVNREVLGSRLNAITCHLLRSCVYTARPVGSLTLQVGLDLLLVYLGITNTVCLELRLPRFDLRLR